MIVLTRYQAPRQRSGWVAPAREYPTVSGCHAHASSHFNRLRADGQRKHHGLHRGQPEIQSPTSCEQRANICFFAKLTVRIACRRGDRFGISTWARYCPRRHQGGEYFVYRKHVTYADYYHQINILIDSNYCARVADFGLAVIVEESASREPGGTARWVAPGLMNPEKLGFTRGSLKRLPSKSTDVYAIGMILEVSAYLYP